MLEQQKGAMKLGKNIIKRLTEYNKLQELVMTVEGKLSAEERAKFCDERELRD